jgi:NAD(P)-dependent dehydrogenase (short-subunit alcohol dehydrogenase family)
VVNDVAPAGEAGSGAADEVARQIAGSGGAAVAVAERIGAAGAGERLVAAAVDAFGRLDIVVNNAGILRDRTLTSMSDAEWDDVVAVHLRGHFDLTRAAAMHWRGIAKAGGKVSASVIHTSSSVGLAPGVGHSNYVAAKAGIAAFSLACAKELPRYGGRSNCILPGARTALTTASPAVADLVAAPEDDSVFDQWHPANVSPLVAYLASPDCPLNGRTYHVQGGVITEMQPWSKGTAHTLDRRWTVDEIADALADTPQPGLAW